MPAQWTAEILGEMHLHRITAKQLSEKLGYNPKYVSAVMNGRKTPKKAEAKFRAALAELIDEKKGVNTVDEHHNIPLSVFTKGQPFEKVLEEYMRIWNDAKKCVTAPGKDNDEIFADTMKAAAYRLYLLGVEDGMKE